MNIAHYEFKYGQLPFNEMLEMAHTNEPNDEQLKLLTSGLETLVGVLGSLYMILMIRMNINACNTRLADLQFISYCSLKMANWCSMLTAKHNWLWCS